MSIPTTPMAALKTAAVVLGVLYLFKAIRGYAPSIPSPV